MPVDILDQPRGGILETVVLYLQESEKQPVDSLVDKMARSDEGRKYFERNVLDLLEALGFISIEDGKLHLKDCRVISRWHERYKTNPFDTYFKVQLLSKILSSRELQIRYFGEVLRKIFDCDSFTLVDLEQVLREVRGNVGIPVSAGEELGGKVDFCLQFLRYFPLVFKTGNNFQALVPRSLLGTIFSLALDDIGKPSVRLYSELLDYIDRNYLPTLDRGEERVLRVVYKTMCNVDFVNLFRLANVPDGGRTVTLAGKDYNAILVR
jgi:hypothetical protein